MIWFRYTKTLLILLSITLFLLCTACGLSEEVGQSTIYDKTVESETESSSRAVNSSVSKAEPESVSGTESNTDNASDTTVLNPEIPAMTSSQDNVPIESCDDWQAMLDRATAMEKYLRSVLSDRDHGGLSVFTGTRGDTIDDTANDVDIPRILIYAMNKDAINQAIQLYTGKQCEVITKDAKWSLEDMNNFADVLKAIKVQPEETLSVYISEESSQVIANISKTGADRLKNEISTLMQNYNIPNECVWIWTLGGNGASDENPVT